ncbi:MAG: dethiobiotin synthase [Planctomycetes bacterium]|nr:dethiobiotin synthase [Planctomycetota bacterium]
MTERESLDARLAAERARWEAAGLRRELALATPALVDFTSNDYLGLARHPQVIEAAREALREYGAGGRASRLLGGGSVFDERAEDAVAAWLGAESALLFPSGYQANVGVVQALIGPGDVLLSDELNHASLIDAGRISRARVVVYRHADVEDLERQLTRIGAAARVLVATESVFSMDGDLAPLADVARVCRARGAWLLVDEAHAVGVIGRDGAGAWSTVADELGGASSRDFDDVLAARIVTGGKALGVTGAFVVGRRSVREHLIQRARSFVFTTAVSPAVSGALCAAIELARRADNSRAKLIRLARALALACGAPTPAAAIVPVILGEEARALDAARLARERGLDVRAVRPPTVPRGTSRLRLVCHSFNTDAELARLAQIARELAPELVTELGGPVGSGVTGGPGGPGGPGAAAAPASTRIVRAPNRHAARAATPCVVAGTDTGIGKTVVSALLARALGARGAYWKPVQTGDESDTRTVIELARTRTFEPGASFAKPASPHEAARAEGRSVDVAGTTRLLGEHAVALGGGVLLVELAGGLSVPWTDEFTQLDWLARERPALVLVARSGLGTLNHTLLSLEALRARGLEPRALFLVGDEHPSNRETLRALGKVALLFEVPRFEPLSTATLELWLARNDLGPLFDEANER